MHVTVSTSSDRGDRVRHSFDIVRSWRSGSSQFRHRPIVEIGFVSSAVLRQQRGTSIRRAVDRLSKLYVNAMVRTRPRNTNTPAPPRHHPHHHQGRMVDTPARLSPESHKSIGSATRRASVGTHITPGRPLDRTRPSFTTHQHNHNESRLDPHPTRPTGRYRPSERHVFSRTSGKGS